MPWAGLEPAQHSPLRPQHSVSTNSTTRAKLISPALALLQEHRLRLVQLEFVLLELLLLLVHPHLQALVQLVLVAQRRARVGQGCHGTRRETVAVE